MGNVNEDFTGGLYGGMGGGGYGYGGFGGCGFGGIGLFGLVGITDLFGRRGFRDGEVGGHRELEMAFDGTNRNIDALRGEIEKDHLEDTIESETKEIQAQLGNFATRVDAKFDRMADCCCDIKGAIKDSSFQAAIIAKDNLHVMDKGFCAVAEAIHCDGDKTRALINALDREALRDKLAKETLENSQLKQNAFFLGALDHRFAKQNESINANFGTITKTNTNTGVQA